MQTVWSVWWSGVTDWRGIDWREIGGNYLEVKAVELALNYTKHMARFHLRPPILSDVRGQDRQQRARQMLTMWTKVMQSAKEAQMQMLKEDDWPPYEGGLGKLSAQGGLSKLSIHGPSPPTPNPGVWLPMAPGPQKNQIPHFRFMKKRPGDRSGDLNRSDLWP